MLRLIPERHGYVADLAAAVAQQLLGPVDAQARNVVGQILPRGLLEEPGQDRKG